MELDIPLDERGSLPQPDIRPIKESGQLYLSYQKFSIGYGSAKITVPAGFRSDGASVPRWAWTITGLGRDGMHRAAAHIHDYIYENQGIDVYPHYISRETADKIFREMLRIYGIKKWQVALMYKAVRLGGKKAWETK